jgi:hypothetical protein
MLCSADIGFGMAARDRAMLLFVVTCPSPFLLKQQVEKESSSSTCLREKESITQSLYYIYEKKNVYPPRAKWRGNMIVSSAFNAAAMPLTTRPCHP